MAVVDQLNLNVGTEQNPNFVLHDINDKRISTTAVTTATHLLTCNSGVTSIAPITAANLASVLGEKLHLNDNNLPAVSNTTSFDSLMNNGRFYVGKSHPDKPSIMASNNSCLLEVTSANNGTRVVQILYEFTSIPSYFLIRMINSTALVWSSWYKFSGTAL